jgi:hypothetical protein
MYAEKEGDYLLFQHDDGGMQVLETPFLLTVRDHAEMYVPFLALISHHSLLLLLLLLLAFVASKLLVFLRPFEEICCSYSTVTPLLLLFCLLLITQ